MRITFLISAMLCLARLTSASPLVEYFADAAAAADPTRIVHATLERPVDPAGPGPVTVYDNYTAPQSGGRFHWNGVYRSADDTIEEDIHQVFAASTLSAYYLPFSNMSSSGRLSRFSYSLEFIDTSGARIGMSAFNVDLSLFPLPANSTGILAWPDGAFDGVGIQLPSSFKLRIRLFDPVGIVANDLGFPFGGPVTAGYSAPGMRNVTTNSDIALTGEDTLEFFIRGRVIPCPSVGFSASIGVCFALRRRR